jgi:hypothetical protein
MRAHVSASAGKSSKQTLHVSASLYGCAGLVDDDPAEEVDFEVELEAVDVVSLALPFVGFNELESESISVPTTLIILCEQSLVGYPGSHPG